MATETRDVEELRLTGQRRRTRYLMADGAWRTSLEVARFIGGSESAATAIRGSHHPRKQGRADDVGEPSNALPLLQFI